MTTEITSIIGILTNGGAMAFLVAYLIYQDKVKREDKLHEEEERCKREDIEKEKDRQERERYNATLEQIAKSSENVANTLDLLKKQMETNDTTYRNHDERAIGIANFQVAIDNKLDNIISIVSSCRKN